MDSSKKKGAQNRCLTHPKAKTSTGRRVDKTLSTQSKSSTHQSRTLKCEPIEHDSSLVHEVQESECGEEGLENLKKECIKNPGHPLFIPILLFTLNHLPKGLQDKDLYELIVAVGVLTVRVTITATSQKRPDYFPNTKIPYYLSDKRGKKTFRFGTGIIRGAKRNNSEKNKEGRYKTCPCDKCTASDKPSKVWWDVHVLTAAHVVFDNIEANYTSFRLFYDSEDSEVTNINQKVFVVSSNIEKDTCLLSCVTCDTDLGPKLEKAWGKYEHLWYEVSRKYMKTRGVDKLAFIVSHPHGCSKQVSIGQWVKKEQWGEFVDYKFTYNTCSCPGSSGAHVHCVGYSVPFIDHVHSGSYADGNNISGVGAIVGADAETV